MPASCGISIICTFISFFNILLFYDNCITLLQFTVTEKEFFIYTLKRTKCILVCNSCMSCTQSAFCLLKHKCDRHHLKSAEDHRYEALGIHVLASGVPMYFCVLQQVRCPH